ncbi:MAG: delta(1)-pyrroline-2-carboxylate reductase family protein [Gammaproteobacteria bacterium]|nr:delta(1)-pyrroline-2-carboxylate reductase family protein [Gammaproteobacteria bacterium]
MRQLDTEQTRALLDYQAVADACADLLMLARQGKTVCPPRSAMPLAKDGTLLLMPATDHTIAITKLVTVHPLNVEASLPTIQGEMVIVDAANGKRLLLADGAAVSARRTAAVSLLAAQRLGARRDSPILVYGAGTQAQVHLEAFQAGLGITRGYIVSRSRDRAEALAKKMHKQGLNLEVIDDPDAVLNETKVIVTATTSNTPVLPEHLSNNTFVAAVGAFRPQMAEIPPALIKTSRIVIDTEEGAKDEAGDLIQAEQQGQFEWSKATTLEQVVCDNVTPQGEGAIIFKSVGQSLWDLAAARVLVDAMDRAP